MTYNIDLEEKINYSLCLADLNISSYTTNSVFTISNQTGNISFTENTGVITFPAGRYMCEAFPYVDVSSTSDQIKFSWQKYQSGVYVDVGLEGQIQVVGDIVGEKDGAISVIDTDVDIDVRLIITDSTIAGTVTDVGGFIRIWKEG
jgi:hypothetical protein